MKQRAWRDYEQVAADLLDRFADRFGLKHVEAKQDVPGTKSGTSWEIDAKGVTEHGKGFIVVECRRHTTEKLKQKDLGALAFVIEDTGASGGIVVSPLGLQEGAAKIASAKNIVSVTLSAESTTTDYVLTFLNEVMAGLSDRIVLGDDEVRGRVTHPDGSTEKF